MWSGQRGADRVRLIEHGRLPEIDRLIVDPQNQPVVDVTTRRTYLTSQNHGYAVRTESIPKGFVPWFENLNDGTNEGLAHESLPIMTVQFHPEAASGPHDTQHVFDNFAKLVLDRAPSSSTGRDRAPSPSTGRDRPRS